MENIESNTNYLTLKDLRNFLSAQQVKDLPDDTPVLIERVEDFYFTPDPHGVTTPWKTISVPYECWDNPENAVVNDNTIFQQFFQAYCISLYKKKILIYAHY